MDHLIRPHETNSIDIPCVCDLLYDDGVFEEFPKRKGWRKIDWDTSRDFGGRSADEVESHFQSWLFFGTIHSIFTITGIPIDVQDFVRTNEQQVRVLSTEKLPLLLQQWVDQMGTGMSSPVKLGPDN